MPFFFAGCPNDILSTSLTSGRQQSWFERQNVVSEEVVEDDRVLLRSRILVDGARNADAKIVLRSDANNTVIAAKP